MLFYTINFPLLIFQTLNGEYALNWGKSKFSNGIYNSNDLLIHSNQYLALLLINIFF